MKKSLKIVLTALLAFVGVSAFASDKPISVSQLPVAAAEYVKAKFPNTPISFATKDGGLFSTDYEVVLADSTMIEFDSAGEWRELKNSIKGISLNLLPEKIKNVIEVRFVGAKVKSIEKKRNVFEVELFNDLELKFDKDGVLISVED